MTFKVAYKDSEDTVTADGFDVSQSGDLVFYEDVGMRKVNTVAYSSMTWDSVERE